MKNQSWIALVLLLLVTISVSAEEAFFMEENFADASFDEETFFQEDSFQEDAFLAASPEFLLNEEILSVEDDRLEEARGAVFEMEEPSLAEDSLSSRDEHQYGLYDQVGLDWLGIEGIWVPANGFDHIGYYGADEWHVVLAFNGYDSMPGGQQWEATGGTLTWQSGEPALKDFLRLAYRYETTWLEFDPTCKATGIATYKLVLDTDQNTTYETSFTVKANGVPAEAKAEQGKKTIYVQPGERICLNDLGLVNASGGMHYFNPNGEYRNYEKGKDFYYEFQVAYFDNGYHYRTETDNEFFSLVEEPATTHYEDQRNSFFTAKRDGTYRAFVRVLYGEYTEYLGKEFDFKIVVGNGGSGMDATLTLNQTSAEIVKGKSLTLKPILTPQNKKAKYIWESSNPDIATVTSKGVIKGVAKGNATIYVRETESGAEASCNVNVIQPVTSITLLSEGEPVVNLSAIGGRNPVLLEAVVNVDANYQKVTWKSSNTKLATVSETGVVTLNPVSSKKTVSITATATDGSKKKATAKISILPIPVDSVTITDAPASLFVKDTATLAAVIAPIDAAKQTVSWKSSDTKVLGISAKGVITAKKAGTAVITMTSKSNKEAMCQVTIEVKNHPVETIVLNMTELTLKAGKSTTLKATIGPEFATIKGVAWTSSDPTIVTVNTSGKITAKKNVEGTVIITAEAKDGSGVKETCLVTVTK